MAKYSEWTPELEEELRAPFPDAYVQQKQIKGTRIDFVPWYRYVSKLNYLCGPGWHYGTNVEAVAGKVIVRSTLTIFGVTRENWGDEDADHEGYGSPVLNAQAQGFKRAAAMFGVGLSMYSKDKK